MNAHDEDTKPKPKKPVRIKPAFSFVFAWCVIIAVVLGVDKFWPHPNPVPAGIKKQVGFAILYPANYAADPSSWKYQASNSTLSVTVKRADYTIALTEQRVPLAYQNDQAAYDRFIGGLRPKATFIVPLGSVSIVNFVTAGNYNPTGPAGILKAKGTLLIAHPDELLSDDQWRNLFESIKAD